MEAMAGTGGEPPWVSWDGHGVTSGYGAAWGTVLDPQPCTAGNGDEF